MTEKSSKKPLVIVVAGALVDADGRVLITRRPNGKEMAGLWEFPGGKIEKGETPEQALIGELKEELNIETKGTCLAPLSFASHQYENFHLLMPFFICRRHQSGAGGRRSARSTPLGRLGENTDTISRNS